MENATHPRRAGTEKVVVTPIPRAGKVDAVAAYVGVSRAMLYREHKAGRIQFMKIDGCTLVEYREADRWYDSRAQPLVAA